MPNANEVVSYYENLDTTDFPIVEPMVLQTLKQRKRAFLEAQQTVFGFENEVADWLSHQNPDTKQVINGFIKNLMHTQSHFAHSSNLS